MSPIDYHSLLRELPSHCRLIAVSKMQSEEAIRALAWKGQKLFAENYVQEALPKIEHLKDLKLEWHFIGHLQRNKVKNVVGTFRMIHSVDREELLAEIDKIAGHRLWVQDILLELNLSGEESKAGFRESDWGAFPDKVSHWQEAFPNVRICGLMTMPPLQNNPEENRSYFQKLHVLRDLISQQVPSCRELSMGTSSDYKVACSEGATMVRLGTVLFGARVQGGS